MPELRYEVALCPDCGGLESTTWARVSGTTVLHLADGSALTPSEVYIAPVPDPCPAVSAEVDCA